MTSREIVFRCLEFRNPDRAPRHLWATPFVPEFRKDEWDEVRRNFPDDITDPGPFIPRDSRGREVGPVPNSYVDDWGCIWIKGEPGVAGEVKTPPLADWFALHAYSAPWQRLLGARWHETAEAQEKNLASDNPRFMMGWSSVRPFERLQFLRGTENLMLDLAEDSAEIRRLIALVHEYNLAELEGWSKAGVDGVLFMDDWGSQRSLLISPAMWRSVFKPLYRQYCDLLKSGGKKIFFHSDGCIESIFGDLVELGIDAVNSQLFTMDIEGLAARYKGKITFWGELDRQYAFPFGTIEDVRKNVGRVRRALDDGQGGVAAQFEWGAIVPKEKIYAAYEAWSEPIERLP